MKYVNIFTGWKTRYCIICGHELIYKKSKEDIQPKKVLNLLTTEISMNDKNECEIILKSHNKKHYQLKCSNVTEKIQWVDAMRTAAQQSPGRKRPDTKSEEKVK